MEEKKEIRVKLSTVVYLFIIFALVITVGVVYYFGFVKDNNAEGEVKETNNISVNEQVTETNNTEGKDTEKSPYEKYEGLYWQFKDSESDKTKVEWDNKKIKIENGIAYLYTENSRKTINSIEGNAKYINTWGEQTLERVYILTEEGTMWKSICEQGLNSNFVKVNMNEKVIDMTNGNSSIKVVEPPYFLLANGKLVNEDGTPYENLHSNFVKSLGNTYERIFIKEDNTMYTYDYETKKYIQIKDEDNNSIKMKDAFVQWSSTHNNLVQETGGDERIFVITEDNKLVYFNGYSNIIAKEYKETAGKTIKNVEEEKQEVEYGGHITNVRITFTDGTEKVIMDANRNFFSE